MSGPEQAPNKGAETMGAEVQHIVGQATALLQVGGAVVGVVAFAWVALTAYMRAGS